MAAKFVQVTLCVYLLSQTAFSDETQLVLDTNRDDVTAGIPDQDVAAGRLFKLKLPTDKSNIQVSCEPNMRYEHTALITV